MMEQAKKVYDPAIQAALQALVEELTPDLGGGKAKKKVAGMLGYTTETALVRYLSSSYGNGDVEKLERTAREVLDSYRRAKEARYEYRYVPTSISGKIYSVIELCHLSGEMAIECGGSGLGKTSAAQQYLADHPNGALYMEVDDCCRHLAALLRELCAVLGLRRGCKDAMSRAIREKLSHRNLVLIIDEAHHLDTDAIDWLRQLVGRLPDLGLVLIGNPNTLVHRSPEKLTNMEQVTERRRFTNQRHKGQITVGDMALLYPAIAGDAAAVRFMHKIASEWYTLHRTTKVYRDGRRIGIDSYSEMAVRTANKRAHLMGEGATRAEWGESAVYVSQYGACSPVCLPWQGRVYVDDVYSGGKPTDYGGRYPLLSEAVAAGLFHPNCRHTMSAYFEDINEVPPRMDAEDAAEHYALEQRQRYNERQIRRYKRLEAGSLDPANQAKYRDKVHEWQARQREHMAAHGDVLRRDYARERTRGGPSGAAEIRTPPYNSLIIQP